MFLTQQRFVGDALLAIQIVEILWTKATRGAPRSKERVGLARAFPMVPEVAECIVQRHRLVEWEGFAPQSISTEALASVPGTVEVLRIVPEKAGAFVLGMLGTPHGGQPERHAIHNAIRLLPGQWARLVVNARHASTAGQHYSETIFHVACGIDIASNRFLRGAPDHELDLKAALF